MAAVFAQIEGLTKSYGHRMLFADVTFGINEGDKIGIIAKNGTGKTTLLRILAGEEDCDSGTVTYRNNLRIGYLPQVPHFEEDLTVLESCPIPTPPEGHEPDWTYHDRLRQTLFQLGITDLDQKMGQLSGGQKKRVAIAKMLLEEPELILLDEPTNHLDIDVIEWLEAYLKRSRATLLMVTHDRYFLDRICNQIIEIDREQIYTYQGNYDYYLRRRAERIEAMSAEADKVRNILRREQDWMSRQPQARAGKAKYRIDSFYDLKDKAQALRYQDRNVTLDVKSSYIGSKIFEAKHICKSFGDKKILDDFNYIFARYEKVGIIGGNGVGKSTLVKLLQGYIPVDSGEWDVGTTVRFGYYGQDGLMCHGVPAKQLTDKKVIDVVTDIAEEIVLNGGEVYSPLQFLQRFLFTPKDQQKYISTLSGGELARLHLATVLMGSPNFLILDEPTNDLDIVTLGILEEYLSQFKGCVMVISHDRYFLDNIVDHLFVMEGDGVVKDYPGTYTEYREYLDEQNKLKQAEASQKTEAPKREKPKAERPRKLSFKEQREFETLTKEIDQLTQEKGELEALFNSGEQIADVATKAARYEQVKDILDEKEMRWLELSELA